MVRILCLTVKDPNRKVPDMYFKVVDHKLQVADLKAEAGELRSGGIPQFNPCIYFTVHVLYLQCFITTISTRWSNKNRTPYTYINFSTFLLTKTKLIVSMSKCNQFCELILLSVSLFHRLIRKVAGSSPGHDTAWLFSRYVTVFRG